MKERCYRGSWSKREAVRTWWQSQDFQKTQIKLNSSTQKSKKKNGSGCDGQRWRDKKDGDSLKNSDNENSALTYRREHTIQAESHFRGGYKRIA